MAKEKIQYINPSNLSLISYDGKHFDNLDKKQKLYTASRVVYDDVVLYSFKVQKTQSNEEIDSMVEIRMYEEAGLDVNKSYKISYLVKELDFDEMNLVEAFAVEIDSLKKSYSGLIKKISYIDFLALPFLAYSTFYIHKILTPKNDIFIYMDDDEAFLSFYKNGSYISSKSMMTLNDIVKKLGSKGADIELSKLKEVFQEQGFRQELYEKSDAELFLALESIFSDILTKMNNIAMHNRSIFGFDKIERIFFSTNTGRIKGLKEFIINFGFADAEIFDFNLFKQKFEDGFLDKIVCSYIYDKFEQKSDEQNITIFEKPPAFLSTQFGKLILSLSLFVVVLCGIYAFFYITIEKQKAEKEDLSTKYHKIEKRAHLYKKQIKNELDMIKKEKKEIKNQDIILKNIKLSIDKLEEMKGKDNRYITFLVKINELLQKYKLHTKNIEQIGRNKMFIEVIANYKDRDKIAKFIKSLINEGFVNVKTKEIKLDKNIYISRVEIEHE